MRRNQLLAAIDAEIDRIWGEDGFDGTSEDYQWIKQNYGISEEDHVLWQLIFEYDEDVLPDEDREDKDLMVFLEDKKAVREFLQDHLQKYLNSSIVSSKRKNSTDDASEDL